MSLIAAIKYVSRHGQQANQPTDYVRGTVTSEDPLKITIDDTMQELVSLSERFGIHITFSKPDKATFLAFVANGGQA